MRAEKRAPRGRPLTARRNALGFENGRDRRSRALVADERRSMSGQSVAVPTKNRVRRHERGNLLEYFTSEPLPKHREPPALSIVQPQPPPDQLRLERAIRLTKERDHISLLLLQPSEDRGEEHL